MYIELNYERTGGPNSPERKTLIAALMQYESTESHTAARSRRSDWIRNARAEFQEFVRDHRGPCAICGKHPEFVHAHHSFPLSLQFECGLEDAIHDYQWLCPVHHKYVHVLLSGYLLGSRDLSFLDGIPGEYTEEWLAIEKSARQGINLCCGSLGQVPGENKSHRYDPPYSLFLLQHRQHLLKLATKTFPIEAQAFQA